MSDYTFDGDRIPTTTLTVETDEDTGAEYYTATVEIIGLEPVRGTTAEERIAGISSLDPITVSSDSVQDIIDLLIRAALASYESTGLVDNNTYYTVTAVLSGSIRFSIAECFKQANIQA